MMQSTYSYYFLDTGLFTGAIRRTPRPRADIPVPEGQGLREGEFDHLSQRVDLATGEVVDFQPPTPSDDYEWIHDDEQGNRVRRWVLKSEAAERHAQRVAAITRIAELERKEPRARREHEQGIEPSEADRAAGALTLQEIWDEIAVQRAIINSANSTAT